jgi:hypothetical protein
MTLPVDVPVFADRIEHKYQLGVKDTEVARVWREVGSVLAPYGMVPVQEITSVGSVYFDNKDYDLLRYSLDDRLFLVRLRAYELYGRPPEPISGYWVEVKTASQERRSKRRFRLSRGELSGFLTGAAITPAVIEQNSSDHDPDSLRQLYRDTQEAIITMGLKPFVLIVYKRVAFQNQNERLSIDWDVQYYNVSSEVFEFSSWKDPIIPAFGRAGAVILELKYLQGSLPAWFSKLQKLYPIHERECLKTLEAMGILFHGELKQHQQANYFRPRIDAYMAENQLDGSR